MKVCSEAVTVGFPFVGNELGGSHISAIKLIRGLDHNRVKAIVILHQEGGPLAQYLRDNDLHYILSPDIEVLSPKSMLNFNSAVRSVWRYVRTTLPTLRKFVKLHQIDIVHTNDGQIHATWAFVARSAGAKLLWHHRGDPNALGVNTLGAVLANHIVTVSQFALPQRPILPIKNRVSVVHSPFEHPASRSGRAHARRALIKELGCSRGTRFVGYFGGLIDRKRPLKFVEIVHAYRQRNPDTMLVGLLFGAIVPNGPALDIAVRDRAKELGIDDRIHLMGYRDPVEPSMCAVDVLLVPAVNEPFGRTLIEAMLLGTPVIATRHGGNPEAIVDGRTGYLVEAENPEAFVRPLNELLNSPQTWRRISESAREAALVKYGISGHIESITGIYERMAKKKS